MIAWIVAVLTLLYMLPWAIAATRNKDVASVGLINFFLGWSIVGWIVALVMACGSTAPTVVTTHVVQPMVGAPVLTHPAGWYPSPDGYGRQYWDGTNWTGHRAP